jgi:ketosteroid isomerase-like protein
MKITLPRLTRSRIAGLVLLAVAAGFGIYLLVRQNVTSEEARVRRLIRNMERAFEEERLKRCMAVVADDYSDNFWNSSKAQLEDNLRYLFQASHTLRLRLDEITIRIRGNEADVALTATADAQTTFGDFSLDAEVGHSRFVLALRKEHGRWKVYRAEGVGD